MEVNATKETVLQRNQRQTDSERYLRQIRNAVVILACLAVAGAITMVIATAVVSHAVNCLAQYSGC